ncbi:hypothetical protein [Paracoccus sp. J39]|uniref:hypothetical protein n=1 Tax=Paracoccus sp. J39 TaxID=935848 RepID=UPI00048D5944|nr:hypothetical protein [Paracoccus sp. J39]
MRDDKTSAQARDKVRERYFESIDPEVFDQIWEQARAFAPVQMQIERADVERVVDFVNLFASESKLDPGIIENSYYVAP